MFGIDFPEIALIFFIALIVLGPQKLPRLAATIGKWVGRARLMARQFRDQLEQEANALQRSADLNEKPKSSASSPPASPPMSSAVASGAPVATTAMPAATAASEYGPPSPSPETLPPAPEPWTAPEANALPPSAPRPVPAPASGAAEPVSETADTHERGH